MADDASELAQTAGRLVLPFEFEARDHLRETQRRLVHYTSAEAGMGIITGEAVWLRKATVMNDWREMEYGSEALKAAWGSPAGIAFQEWLDGLFPDFRARVAKQYDDVESHLKFDTFILSLSEHLGGDEDDFGRLSMWRAYGGRAGVALIMNTDAFLSETDALNAYSSKVRYISIPEFVEGFGQWANTLKASEAVLRAAGPELVAGLMFTAFRLVTLGTKHPGFKEEQEWRVFHTPALDVPSPLVHSIETIRGTPQPIMKIELRPYPEDERLRITIPDLLHRVVIGPTEHSDVIWEAYRDALIGAGVTDAVSRIGASNIPLRQ